METIQKHCGAKIVQGEVIYHPLLLGVRRKDRDLWLWPNGTWGYGPQFMPPAEVPERFRTPCGRSVHVCQRRPSGAFLRPREPGPRLFAAEVVTLQPEICCGQMLALSGGPRA